MQCCSGKNRPWLWIAIVALVALVVLGYYFQWPVITNYWWMFIILLCPLMHLFMGHGGHEERSPHNHEPKKDGHSCCH